VLPGGEAEQGIEAVSIGFAKLLAPGRRGCAEGFTEELGIRGHAQ
jgi:hypothetical protein